VIAYDGLYRGQEIRVIALLVPCGGQICTVQVAETTNKRRKLARNIVLSSLVPELLITLATLALVWFGVKRGLAPLEDLSNEIRARSARDLRPIDPGHAPEEAAPLVGALEPVVRASRRGKQQPAAFPGKRGAPAAHAACRTAGAYGNRAGARRTGGAPRAVGPGAPSTIRTARLANQLACAGARRTGRLPPRRLCAGQPARNGGGRRRRMGAPPMAKEIDLGFELADAQVQGDALLLREALGT